MRSHFLESFKPSIAERWNDILKEKPLKRKFIKLGWCNYSYQYQFGITFHINKPDKDLLEFGDPFDKYECYHAHLWIDLGKWCIEITFMDYA